MKSLYSAFGFMLLLGTSSCVSNYYEEDEFITPDGGNIQVNNTNFPVYYTDVYSLGVDNITNYESLFVTLTDNFTTQGIINSNAVLYLKIQKPYNSSLEGIYYLTGNSSKSVNFIEFYRYVIFNNGFIVNTNGNFTIPDYAFTNGQLRIQYLFNNRYLFQYEFYKNNQTIQGEYKGYISGY